MRIIKGKGVVPEIAVGKFFMLDRKSRRTAVGERSESADGLIGEAERLKTAVCRASDELSELSELARERVGLSEAEIFETQRLMLTDEDLYGTAEKLVADGLSAEEAIRKSGDVLKAMLLGSDSEYMRQRAADVEAVLDKVCEHLSGKRDGVELTSPAVIGAFDLTPAQTLTLDRDMVLGFVTGAGGTSSHTAILARSMNIPAVVGAGELPPEADGATVILDGCEGLLIISPDSETLELYGKRTAKKNEERRAIEAMSGVGLSYMGRDVRICANIASPSEALSARRFGADGIGLFRSEFLYMKHGREPSEAEQYEAYCEAARGIDGGEVIIRTLDAGADKDIPYLGLKKEPNPALGLRAIRLSLAREETFRIQIKALLRAAARHRISIMLPMIADISELRCAKRVIDSVKSELSAEKVPFSEDTPIGIMIETPAAAVTAELLAGEADFFSVGTNDLVQYTMAADRMNSDVSYLCDGAPEAVLRLLEHVGKSAAEAGIWAGICGELAADTSLTEFFMKAGYTELSVALSQIPRIKKRLSELDGAAVRAFAPKSGTHSI